MEQRYQAVLAVVQDGWRVVEVARRAESPRSSASSIAGRGTLAQALVPPGSSSAPPPDSWAQRALEEEEGHPAAQTSWPPVSSGHSDKPQTVQGGARLSTTLMGIPASADSKTACPRRPEQAAGAEGERPTARPEGVTASRTPATGTVGLAACRQVDLVLPLATARPPRSSISGEQTVDARQGRPTCNGSRSAGRHRCTETES
jgi:hypothetical protein